jgi:NADPH-dependent 2,4-dienoyl-CoA reductase/sulfur reductase-like enzyme/rhodanese-related sulfurtransferase
MKIVIVGGVAGGMSAATRLRRLDERAGIIVLERSSHVSYANCGLPYFLGGVIEEEDALLLETPATLHDRFRLDVRVRHEVLNIDREAKSVSVKDWASGFEYELTYDKLILSPGAFAMIPPLPGIERAFTLRTVEDVERIIKQVDRKPKSAVIIGGGFIGVEVAENLVRRGIRTAIVETTPQLLAPLDPEMASFVAAEMQAHGVDLRLGETVNALTSETVRLASGEQLAADLVVLAIGVRPDTLLAKAAGIAIGESGGILVDGVNRTSDQSIYAIGDAAEKHDALDASSTLVPLANIASRQGRVVADHISGRPVRAVAALGTAIVKVFDLVVATTGWNEKRLTGQGREFLALHTHPNSHAGYYPDAKPMALKLLVDPLSGTILGAQGVGTEGIDKRIDVLATAIRAGLTAPELADLELAYAPPFGSAKDPVNMLGYVAENLLSGIVETAQWSDVDSWRVRDAQFVDVRTADEFAGGSLPRAINIPVDELRERFWELDRVDTVVYCQVGQRGYVATLVLNELGFRAVNLDGGYKTWHSSPAAKTLELVR